jgi:putative FmdB family regulatory protein
MPIFEYVCVDCQESFEKIVQKEEQILCPVCSGQRLEKQYSRFGLGSSKESYPSLPLYKSGGCCCSPGNCGCKN